MLLGAGHAALPGHGKTVLAAYLAGKQGRPRDALSVAGTVTLTHTGGVLALGLVLTAGTALAGERILGWLGLASGIVVLAVGASMLVTIIRRRVQARRHTHDHDHDHASDHSHDGHSHHDHTHDGHLHDVHSHHEHSHDGHPHHGHSHHGHSHGRRSGKLGLAGIGLAGGLVPSPSALVVLLAAIGLGRTAFGVGLVVAYGVGMAATLTGAGLLLLVLQRRLARATSRTGRTPLTRRLQGIAARLNSATPAATAALVLVVGAGLAVRAAASVL
jgi:ABC-type nickel/cobalt efflux system permease component RcnA